MKVSKKKFLIYLVLGILTFLFFEFGEGVLGYNIGGDSEAYYIHFEHHMQTAPLYPLFFHICDLIAGSQYYLYLAVIFQMILAIFSVIYFVRYISERFNLNIVGMVIVWIATLLPFYVLLPENPIPHDLMTESLTYPMMYIYTVMVMKGFLDDDKHFYYSVIMTELMALVRGQMMYLFAVTFSMLIIKVIRDYCKDGIKKVLTKCVKKGALFVLAVITCFVVGKLSTIAYEHFFFNAPSQNFGTHLAVQKAIYLADEEDANLFEDEITRDIFEKTYKRAYDEQSLYIFADKSDLWMWKHAISSFGANSWNIGDQMNEVFAKHNMIPNDEIAYENLKLSYYKVINSTLLKDNWKKYVSLFFDTTPSAFVSTILFHKESIYGLIHIATLILYLVAIVGSCAISIISKKLLDETVFMWLVLINAIVNAVSTNIAHMGVQRYQAYTVGMFYVGFFLLFCCFFIRWKKAKEQ